MTLGGNQFCPWRNSVITSGLFFPQWILFIILIPLSSFLQNSPSQLSIGICWEPGPALKDCKKIGQAVAGEGREPNWAHFCKAPRWWSSLRICSLVFKPTSPSIQSHHQVVSTWENCLFRSLWPGPQIQRITRVWKLKTSMSSRKKS